MQAETHVVCDINSGSVGLQCRINYTEYIQCINHNCTFYFTHFSIINSSGARVETYILLLWLQKCIILV